MQDLLRPCNCSIAMNKLRGRRCCHQSCLGKRGARSSCLASTAAKVCACDICGPRTLSLLSLHTFENITFMTFVLSVSPPVSRRRITKLPEDWNERQRSGRCRRFERASDIFLEDSGVFLIKTGTILKRGMYLPTGPGGSTTLQSITHHLIRKDRTPHI